MALDEPKSEDKVFDEKGIKFIIDKSILNQAKPINVDFVDSGSHKGFKLTSSVGPTWGGCGSPY